MKLSSTNFAKNPGADLILNTSLAGLKRLGLLVFVIFALQACGEGGGEASDTTSGTGQTTPDGNPPYDPERGAGKFKDVQIPEKLDPQMAAAGENVYEVKCASCHKLSDERLVGPGWKGVTTRHRPEWIMNFVTNVDEMLDKDPKAQAQLEICLVRMPNQNLTDEDARSVYEFMRKNDGVQ